MLTCFYRANGKVETAIDLDSLAAISPNQVLWLDLFNPADEERAAVEAKFSLELFTRQEAEEIESSSKYFENEEEINTNVNYIYLDGERYAVDPVSFILKDHFLITQRNIPLRSFEEVKRLVRHSRRSGLSGASVFLLLFEVRVDIEADFLEALSKRIYAAGRDLALVRKVEEQVLIEIYHLQEITIQLRESTSEMKRLFSSILRSEYFPKDEYEKIRMLIKDADSLLGHTAFNFERLEYLQNTFLGLIDMEQNKIIKIFTVMTVVFMPPTMIASLYGMNFDIMPELHWSYGYPFAIGIMAASSLVTLFYFKRKKWL
jgi:magnesium transporter